MSSRGYDRSFDFRSDEVPEVRPSHALGEYIVGGSNYDYCDWTATEARLDAIEAIAWYRFLKEKERQDRRDDRKQEIGYRKLRAQQRRIEAREMVQQRIAQEKRELEASIDALLAHARLLLEDGASYTDVAETVGASRQYLSKHLPGYGWSHQQAGQKAHAVRMARKAGVDI